MSSAQSAASAAFKSSLTSNQNVPRTKLRLPADGPPRSKTSITAAQTLLVRSQKAAAANKVPQISPLARAAADRANVSRSQSKQAADDDVTSLALTASSPVANRAIGETTQPLRRHLTKTNPHEMLEKVRNSINAKSKVGIGKEIGRRLQAALNEFRHSVDLRRLRSQLTFEISSSSDTEGVYHHGGISASHSSLGLGSDCDISIVPELQLESEQDKKPQTSTSQGSTSPKFNVHRSDTSNVSVSSTNVANIAPISASNIDIAISVPIAAPPGPSVAARVAPELVAPEPKEPPKARRKPPPNLDSADDLSLSGHSLGIAGSDDEEHRLPVFPTIGEKLHKRKLIFHKRRSHPAAVYDRSLLDDSDEPEFVPSRSATPVVALPQVKFKTTMREGKRGRRAKKTIFNEDKPWKNHSDLDYVTEAQRKRYEGLWVSNRGLYMDRVLTPLVGVSYDNKNSNDSITKDKNTNMNTNNVADGDYTENEKNGDTSIEDNSEKTVEKSIIINNSAEVTKATEKALSRMAMSERAAKLSTRSTMGDIGEGDDVIRLHSLVDADVHDLIHGVVVKRLWIRSKLSNEVLAAVWDLVDFRKDGTLNRAEFIVGTWLVDQCLYGRKLPKVVNELVWASLGSMGLRVVIKKKKR